jgi:hypothetical protein
MNPAPSPRHAQPRKATGKLAVLMPGMGAVATTTMAGVMLSRRGLGAPVGSLTQLGRVRVHDEARAWKEVLPLASLADVEFGGWDLFPEDALTAARHADVLSKEHLDLVADELSAIRPMEAVFYPEYVSRLHGTHVKRGKSKAELVEALQSDIRGFIKQKGADRAVAVWCGSTEKYLPLGAVHASAPSSVACGRTIPASPPRRCTPGRVSRSVFPSPTARPTSGSSRRQRWSSLGRCRWRSRARISRPARPS